MPSTFSAPKTPRASQSGVPIVADTRQLARLAKDLRAASPAAWKACRLALRAVAVPVAQDAQARAGFSRRIPGSIKIRTARGNVKIVAGGAAAPNASPIENKGKGFIRHPVFGDRKDWTAKNSRPAFLAPAMDAHREASAQGIEDAVMAAVYAAIGAK